MHTEYFGLLRRPFEILPDSHFLYMSEQHARAVTNIKFALANRDCFVIITGEIGVGKTTILNSVLKSLDDGIEMARLTHTSLSPVELLQAVLLAFDQPVECDSKVLLVDQIRRFLLSKYDEKKHVVIAVDEAQNLGAAALEELRLLTCIEADTRELLTVVLMGQPALSELIDSHELHNLQQRTRLRQHLRRLTLDQTIEYLKHRLLVVGGDYDKVFEHEAVLRIFDATLGTPRLINTLCDTAMTATAIRDLKTVTEECVLEVLDELGWRRNYVAGHSSEDVDAQDLPTLSVFRHGQFLKQVACRLPMISIGRCSTNHLQINDRSISRRHAIVSFLNGQYSVEDLGSTNGTYHNGRECGGRRSALRSGDRIVLGHYQLVFRGTDSNADSPSETNEDTYSVTQFARLGSSTAST